MRSGRGSKALHRGQTPKRGGRWRDHREVIDAIAFKFQTGKQWVHLPERYGNRCINRLRQWRSIATRYDKTATIYLAGLHIAGISLWSARAVTRMRSPPPRRSQ
ncbi:transposase [Streptomyces sp. NPDC007983]|uniref:transposase n=1 Tax=Streptomyces sp. NPDC007983 TaxID=3364800 RepID=UPI0036ED9EDF